MVKLIYEESTDSHYFYVMGWEDNTMKNAPIEKKKFNIYKDAEKYYDALKKECGYVSMFEYIGGKRKQLMSTDKDEE